MIDFGGTYNSSERPEAIFPVGHALERLKRPTFHTIRHSMSDHLVSAIWMDASYYPERAGFRASYDDLYGEGSVNVMPFIAAWLSSGPVEGEQGNTILLPAKIDRSLIEYAGRTGLLGRHRFIANLADFRSAIEETGRRLYAIDSMGPEFDRDVVVSEELSTLLNSKESLRKVSAYAPEEAIKDMFEVDAEDYERVRAAGAGRVYLKTCNTEAAGAGVFVCNNRQEFDDHLKAIRAKQKEHDLNRTLIVQPELQGRNRSFQVFLDPADRNCIQVITLTDQLVEDDGVTYRGSVNYPATEEHLSGPGPVILDMVDRVLTLHPDAFGILMCDFFETPDGRYVVYDPGIRPTGNTATAMAALYAADQAGRQMYVSNMHLRSGRKGYGFGNFASEMGAICEPGHIASEGTALFPWGWNDILGFGVLIGVAPDEQAFAELKSDVLKRLDAG